MRLTNRICIIILSFLQLESLAQPQKNIQFHHFSQDHALPISRCQTIIQDKKGYIWFGSTRYDGTSFKSFEPDYSDKNLFAPEGVYRLCRDMLGNLWGVGWSGIFKYNPDSEIFSKYFANDTVFPRSFVHCITADKQGKIWFGMNTGVGYYEPPADQLINFSKIIYPDTLSNHDVSSFLLDHNGLLWIGTANGINIYDPIHKKLKLFDPEDKDFYTKRKNVVCMLEDHTGNIWISFYNEGVYRYDPLSGSSNFYYHSSSRINSICSNNVTTLFEDKQHNIWAGSYSGLSIYQPATDNFKTYKADPYDKYSLSSDLIETLFKTAAVHCGLG